jgi:hypothetical protein
MTTETAREPQMGLTFEKVWAMFQETDRQIKETDRIVKENARQMKETDRKIGNLGGRIGELVEHLMAPGILEKFNKLGYTFGKVGANIRYAGTDGSYLFEIDLLLENGDTAVAVEVKTKLTQSDVLDHAARMEKLRLYADTHQDSRKLLGAVAGAVMSREVKDFAVKKGFFVLEQSGDTIKISVPDGFTPREW